MKESFKDYIEEIDEARAVRDPARTQLVIEIDNLRHIQEELLDLLKKPDYDRIIHTVKVSLKDMARIITYAAKEEQKKAKKAGLPY